MSPLQLAIMRTPKTVTGHEEDDLQVVAHLTGQELGMLAVVDALIDCGADLDYLSHHGSALMVALTLGEDCAALRLLYHGASTSLVHVDSGRTALIAATSPESRCSPALYAALVRPAPVRLARPHISGTSRVYLGCILRPCISRARATPTRRALVAAGVLPSDGLDEPPRRVPRRGASSRGRRGSAHPWPWRGLERRGAARAR